MPHLFFSITTKLRYIKVLGCLSHFAKKLTTVNTITMTVTILMSIELICLFVEIFTNSSILVDRFIYIA